MKDKIFEGVLLASDFDATLTNSKGEILSCVIESIRDFTARGGLFTVSTGRTKQGFIAWNKLPINAPVLLGNGVMGYDYNKDVTVYADAIPVEIKPFLLSLSSAFPDISIELYGTDFTSFCYHPDSVSPVHFANQTIKWKEIQSFDEVSYPLVKIMLSVNTKGEEVCRYIDKIKPDIIKYIWDHGNFIEIISSTAGKGNGLLRLADELGIRHCDVYAAGDGFNDIDMLQAAHIGFSPSNAHPDVLKKTGMIVRDNDHGTVSHIIEILETFYS